jgi:hypothetical protein
MNENEFTRLRSALVAAGADSASLAAFDSLRTRKLIAQFDEAVVRKTTDARFQVVRDGRVLTTLAERDFAAEAGPAGVNVYALEAPRPHRDAKAEAIEEGRQAGAAAQAMRSGLQELNRKNREAGPRLLIGLRPVAPARG